MNTVSDIKKILPLSKVVEAYTGEKLIRNKMRCPFHSEKTASFTVYDNGSFYCFGCGVSGDVFSFVQKLFNINFRQAMKQLDTDFGLALYEKPSLKDYRKTQKRMREIEAKREQEKKKKEEIEEQYRKAFAEWVRLDNNRRQYAPKTIYEEWHPLFAEALKKIKYAEYLLDKAEVRRRIFENERRNNTVNANS